MKRGLIIGLAAGAVALVIIWYLLLFSPTSKKLSDTRSQVSSTQREKEQLENTVRELKQLSQNAPQQQATLNTLQAAIPANPDLGEFIIQANSIASESGIDFLSISPSPPAATPGGGNSTIALSIQINGGFFQVLDYLNRLEDLDRLVIVDTISLSAASAGGGSGTTGTSGSSSGSSTGTSSGASSSSSSAGTDSTGAPNLSVTLTGRMFTTAAAPPPTGTTAGGSTPGGTTTAPTTPTTTATNGPSAGSSSSNTGNS